MRKGSKLMRVPIEFSNTVETLSKKHGLSQTKFLKYEGVRVLQNSDKLTDIVGGLFSKKRRK